MLLTVGGLNSALWMALSTKTTDFKSIFSLLDDSWLSQRHTLCDRQESFRRLKILFKTFQAYYYCAPQGSNRATFSSFMPILHQLKHNMNSRIVNPDVQKLIAHTGKVMNSPHLLCFMVYISKKKFETC